MADFKAAVAKTLAHEGGYVNNPADKGGPTKYGITQADADAINKQVVDLTPQDAVDYYAAHYWKSGYSQITNQALAEKLFDMGVLFGVGTAVKMLQLSMAHELTIVSDGVFGPQTLQDVNAHGDIAAYKTMLIQHMIQVVNTNPNDHVFVNGWVNRINS